MFLIMMSSKSFAFQIEIAQWIPWKLANQEIAQTISFSSLEKKSIQIQWQDWTPTLSSLKVLLSPKSLVIESGPSGLSAHYGSKEDWGALQIQVGQFAIDQTIYREFGGNKIGIRIKAQCSPFTVDLPAMALSVHAPFVQDGNFFLPRAQEVELFQNQPAALSTIQCYGPMGFEDKVTNLVLETLRNNDVIAQFIKSQLQQLTSEKLASAFKNWMKSKNQNVELVRSSAPFSQGLYIHLLTAMTDSEDGEILQLPADLTLTAPKNGELVQSLISNEQLNRIVEEKIQTQKISKYNLQSISSFSSFMNNRFLQLFVWSDLLHYSRKAPFYLNVQKIESLEIQSARVGEWIVKFQTSGNIESDRKSQKWDFIDWSMGVSSRLSLSIQSGKAVVSTANSLSNFDFQYGSEYEQRFSPGRPSGKILNKAVESALTQKSFELALPKISILGADWKMSKLQFQGEDKAPQIFIEWSP